VLGEINAGAWSSRLGDSQKIETIKYAHESFTERERERERSGERGKLEGWGGSERHYNRGGVKETLHIRFLMFPGSARSFFW
jgi:hypothetical protein